MTNTTEVARHMITADWGIMIDRTPRGTYRVNTVARLGSLGLRANCFAHAATETEARELANKEWRVQTRTAA
jgi:hypothetical protein